MVIAHSTGYGMPMAVATLVFSFYIGAAVLAVLFPLFILVACDSDPVTVHSSIGADAQLGEVPIFNIALWPTEYILGMLLKPRAKKA